MQDHDRLPPVAIPRASGEEAQTIEVAAALVGL